MGIFVFRADNSRAVLVVMGFSRLKPRCLPGGQCFSAKVVFLDDDSQFKSFTGRSAVRAQPSSS